MKHTKYLVALAALLLCSACASKTNVADAVSPQQKQAAHWEEYANIQTIAKPNNTFLIMMR